MQKITLENKTVIAVRKQIRAAIFFALRLIRKYVKIFIKQRQILQMFY